MEAVFLKVLNMSISAGWLVLAVVLLRLILHKAPKAIRVVLWALVGIRLVLPFSIESVLSLIPSAETVPADIGTAAAPAIHSGITALNSAVNPVLSQSLAPTPTASVNPMQVVESIAAWVWAAGMLAMGLYALFSFLRIRLRVREAARNTGNVWLCDGIGSPFILGIFRPRIYLPSGLSWEDIPYVLAHEQAHLQRKDHWWKPLGFGLLAVHWFNPLVWLAYCLLCRDIELACDERVLRALGTGSKKPYSEALINCAMPRRFIAACPLAFGENSIKGRIRSILNYKKPAFWIILVAVIACIAVAVCFLTDPKVPEASPAQTGEPLAQPPTLTVSGIDTAITAWQGGYSWQYEDKNGKTVHTIADSLHPTDAVEDLPCIQLRPSTYSYWESNRVYLDFGTVPDSISVTYHALDVLSSAGGSISADTDSFCLVEGEFLYVIHASWDGRGECTYAFLGDHYIPSDIAEVRALREKYPQYFDLDTSNGLYVFVWKMAPSGYFFGLSTSGEYEFASGYFGYSLGEFSKLHGLDRAQLRLILSTYDIAREDIHLVPFQHPLSSYWWEIDDSTQLVVEWDLWGVTAPNGYTFPVVETAVFDVDGDGNEEVCALGLGTTSGVFSFTMFVQEPGKESLEGYSHYATIAGWFDLSFQTGEDGITRVQAVSQGGEPQTHLFDITVTDGSIHLTENGIPFSQIS